MSHSVDECYAFYRERITRARTEHACSACRLAIRPGDLYARVSWAFDGSLRSVKRCGRCQTIHRHLRKLCAQHDMWPDERLACDLDYKEEWNRDPPEHISELPLIGPDEASALLSKSAGCVP